MQAQYDVGLMYARGQGGATLDVAQAHEWFRSAARRGHAGAQYMLGVAYVSGVGVDADPWEAFQWFFRSHDQGNLQATYQLSRLIDKQSIALRQKIWQLAAKSGIAKAQWELGRRTLQNGAPSDEGQANRWLVLAAEQGLAEAQYELGLRLFSEVQISAEVNQLQAVEWVKLAAAQGMASAFVLLDEWGELDSPLSASGQKRKKNAKGIDELLTQFANGGSAENQYHLGLMYEHGIQVARRYDLALTWYERASSRGNVLAQFKLGRVMAAEDPVASARWYSLAAEQGLAEAQYEYAHCLDQGLGVKVDPLAAHLWYTRAAEQEQPDALNALALALEATKPALAMTCILKAAEAGHAMAQTRLALALHKGIGVQRDHCAAVQWLQRAAESGHAPAQCELATWYANGSGVAQDFARAATWYAQAIDGGNELVRIRAQWGLGSLLAQGGQGLTRDVKRATVLCRKAANAGYAPAQATIGMLMSLAGQHDKALRWWDKAAEQGDPEAQYNLGMARLKGNGAMQDPETAFVWLMYAAMAGVAAAQQRVGFAYATGLGVPQDLVEATKWFILASDRGNTEAKLNLEHARSTLRPQQMADATRRAESWTPKSKTTPS